jgi:membrane protease YdiL (CAAX protease family)
LPTRSSHRFGDAAFATAALTLHLVPLGLATAAMQAPGDDFRSLAAAVLPVSVLIAVLQLALMLAADRGNLVGMTTRARGGWTLAAPILLIIAVIFGSGMVGPERPEVSGLLIVGLALLVAAFNEEFTFRGAIMGAALRHGPPAAAVILSAVLFGAAHLIALLGGADLEATLRQCAAAGLFGVALGLVRLRMPSLWPLVLLHASWNIAVVTAGTRVAVTSQGSAATLLRGIGVMLLVIALVGLALRVHRSRAPRASRAPQASPGR